MSYSVTTPLYHFRGHLTSMCDPTGQPDSIAASVAVGAVDAVGAVATAPSS